MDAKRINSIDWWQKAPVAEKRVSAPIEPPIEPSEPKAEVSSAVNHGTATPLVQPLVVVPYVSTQQPMYYYKPESENETAVSAAYYEDLFEDEESYALDGETSTRTRANGKANRETAGEKRKEKRKANALAIICAILGIVYIALLFDFGKLIDGFNYNYLYDGKSGFDVIMGLVNGGLTEFAIETSLLPILVAASAALVAVTTICSLFTVAGRTPIAVKVIAAIAFVCNAGMAVVAFVVNKIELETYGIIIMAALSLVIFILTTCARAKKRKRA